MIYLDGGYSIEGTISNSIVKLNDEWVKILVIKTSLSKNEAENLFRTNRIFTLNNTVYVADGYIKTLEDDDGTYTWMKFDYSYLDTDKQKIKELEAKVETQNQAIAELTLLMTMGGM